MGKYVLSSTSHLFSLPCPVLPDLPTRVPHLPSTSFTSSVGRAAITTPIIFSRNLLLPTLSPHPRIFFIHSALQPSLWLLSNAPHRVAPVKTEPWPSVRTHPSVLFMLVPSLHLLRTNPNHSLHLPCLALSCLFLSARINSCLLVGTLCLLQSLPSSHIIRTCSRYQTSQSSSRHHWRRFYLHISPFPRFYR